MKQILLRIIQVAVVVMMPLFLGLTNISLIINPAYPKMEYAKANFPPDRFGFTQEQRLELALVAVDYLRRPQPSHEVIYLLEEQRLPGTDLPLYNEREIQHMIDVKDVTDALSNVRLIAAATVIFGLAILLWNRPTRPNGYRAILNGGLSTTMLLLFIALFILLAWNVFFVQFHELLFPPDSWMFFMDDSLIRLFPEKFWFDVGVILSVGTLIEGILVAALGYWLLRRHWLNASQLAAPTAQVAKKTKTRKAKK